VALIVDGIDGTFARALDVSNRWPRWSGDTLDLVVDFTTYVFVPAYAIVASGLIAEPLSWLAGAVIVMTSAIYFADGNMKLAGNYFRGFPALWNVAAFYLLVLRPSPWLAVAIVAVLAVLTFAPIRFVHPFRVRRWRPVTLTVLMVWAVLGLAAILQDLDPGFWVTAGLLAVAVYIVGLGLVPDHQKQAP
jgi:phosphatidylcholine synthase